MTDCHKVHVAMVIHCKDSDYIQVNAQSGEESSSMHGGNTGTKSLSSGGSYVRGPVFRGRNGQTTERRRQQAQIHRILC